MTDELGSHDIDAVLAQLLQWEDVDQEDITIITDEGCSETPGIRPTGRVSRRAHGSSGRERRRDRRQRDLGSTRFAWIRNRQPSAPGRGLDPLVPRAGVLPGRNRQFPLLARDRSRTV